MISLLNEHAMGHNMRFLCYRPTYLRICGCKCSYNVFLCLSYCIVEVIWGSVILDIQAAHRKDIPQKKRNFIRVFVILASYLWRLAQIMCTFASNMQVDQSALWLCLSKKSIAPFSFHHCRLDCNGICRSSVRQQNEQTHNNLVIMSYFCKKMFFG